LYDLRNKKEAQSTWKKVSMVATQFAIQFAIKKQLKDSSFNPYALFLHPMSQTI
jgi:hypothetical protein